MKAFHAGRLPEALSLFETSGKFWNDADAAGERGVCLLLSGNASDGERLIQKAKAMRKGKGVPFEEFYEGIYFFTQGERNKAVPLLQAATVDSQFRWSVVKIFSVMALDDGRPKDAAEQMKPYKDAEITQFDQAYIMASLKLADGKSDEAKTILKKFPAQNLSPAWKKRFEKLQEQIQK
jgi:hypothetical protein